MKRMTAALVAMLTTLFVAVGAALPAYSATGPNYPPSPGATTEVKGVSSGVSGVQGSGMPHTGFDMSSLWWTLALLALGVALVVVSRRRAH
jgi:hypothetical protein